MGRIRRARTGVAGNAGGAVPQARLRTTRRGHNLPGAGRAHGRGDSHRTGCEGGQEVFYLFFVFLCFFCFLFFI